jgi:hypothetical protein
VDWLFSQFAAALPWRASDDQATTAEDLSDEPEEAPTIRDDDDVQAANAWLRRERARLQRYTERQLARIREDRQAAVGRSSLNEQQALLAAQELARKEESLARHSRALQRQSADLSRRELALAARLEQRPHGQDAVGAEQETALLAALRGEIEALQQARAASQAELEALARALEEHRAVRAQEQALVRAVQAQMEERLRALARAEHAAERRAAELEEREIRLRQEFEEQERQLAEQRQATAALSARCLESTQRSESVP